MTFERNDSIDSDVIAALRADARRGVPPSSRKRVLRRLGLSAATLGATVTVATGARAFVASLVAASSTKVLVSTLAIGVGVGVGVHAARDLIRPQTASVPTAAPQASPRPSPAPAQGPSAIPAPAAPPPEADAPSREAASVDPSRPAPHVARSVMATAIPTAALPPPGLAAQQALLDGARRALVRGDGMAALTAIDAHRQRFPDTTLAEERAVLEIRALLALGRLAEARERHAAFERRFPGSLFAPSLRSLVPTAADSVTEPPSPPQE
jgi:hypothetical protein